jgi:DNA replication protein DnaC
MEPNEELVERFLRDVGKRYAETTLRSFVVGTDKYRPQRKAALDKAVQYLTSAKTTILCGKNLVLYGTVGTGKDHLAISIAKACCTRGLSARFITGQDLIAAAERARRNGQEAVDPGIRTCRLLVLSDPLPNATTPRADEARHLIQVVDHRYRNMLPTIVTVNATDEKDLRESLRGPLGDRLLGEASTIEMRWPSCRAIVNETTSQK